MAAFRTFLAIVCLLLLSKASFSQQDDEDAFPNIPFDDQNFKLPSSVSAFSGLNGEVAPLNKNQFRYLSYSDFGGGPYFVSSFNRGESEFTLQEIGWRRRLTYRIELPKSLLAKLFDFLDSEKVRSLSNGNEIAGPDGHYTMFEIDREGKYQYAAFHGVDGDEADVMMEMDRLVSAAQNFGFQSSDMPDKKAGELVPSPFVDLVKELEERQFTYKKPGFLNPYRDPFSSDRAPLFGGYPRWGYEYQQQRVIFDSVISGTRYKVEVSEGPFDPANHKVTRQGSTSLVNGQHLLGSIKGMVPPKEAKWPHLQQMAITVGPLTLDVAPEKLAHIFRPCFTTEFEMRRKASQIIVSPSGDLIFIDLLCGSPQESVGHAYFTMDRKGNLTVGDAPKIEFVEHPDGSEPEGDPFGGGSK